MLCTDSKPTGSVIQKLMKRKKLINVDFTVSKDVVKQVLFRKRVRHVTMQSLFSDAESFKVQVAVTEICTFAKIRQFRAQCSYRVINNKKEACYA